MKEFSAILMFLIFVMTSCSSDDTETKVSENIVGTWVGTALSLSGEIETKVEGEIITTVLIGEGYDLTNRLIFSKSPNILESQGELNMMLSYTVDGETIVEDIQDFELLGEGTWEISGSNLIITNTEEVVDEDENRAVNIFKLTNDELIINITDTIEETEDGVTISSVIKTLASFVRQP